MRDNLKAYLDRELTPAEVEAVERDPSLQAELSQLRAVSQALQKAQTEIPVTGKAALLAKLEPRPWFSRRNIPLMGGLVTAGIATIAMVNVLRNNGPGGPTMAPASYAAEKSDKEASKAPAAAASAESMRAPTTPMDAAGPRAGSAPPLLRRYDLDIEVANLAKAEQALDAIIRESKLTVGARGRNSATGAVTVLLRAPVDTASSVAARIRDLGVALDDTAQAKAAEPSRKQPDEPGEATIQVTLKPRR